MSKINIEKLQANGEPLEIIFREGQAPPMIPLLEDKTYSGTIQAPADYYQSKIKAGKEFDLSDCLLKVDRDGKSLTLVIGEGLPIGTVTVTGNLFATTESASVNKSYTQKSLIKLIRSMKRFFPDQKTWARIVKDVNNFTAQVTKVIEKKDDERGNVVQHFAQNLKTSIDLKFAIRIPLFKAGRLIDLNCEIVPEVNGDSISFLFECLDFPEILANEIEEHFNTELSRLSSVPVIWLS